MKDTKLKELALYWENVLPGQMMLPSSFSLDTTEANNLGREILALITRIESLEELNLQNAKKIQQIHNIITGKKND